MKSSGCSLGRRNGMLLGWEKSVGRGNNSGIGVFAWSRDLHPLHPSGWERGGESPGARQRQKDL